MKDFIPYEEALVLKELGFDEEPFAWYHEDVIISKTLYSQAFRWFREKHELYHDIYLQGIEQKFTFLIIQGERRFVKGEVRDFDTYEEAELTCLRKLIEIVKTK